ncbi:MAG: M1 family peptidase [Calditrichaeota bacterium]|nr:MAG: M1 family peptidase [Calditrichota bacterium]
MWKRIFPVLFSFGAVVICSVSCTSSKNFTEIHPVQDAHSYANTDSVVIRHLTLKLTVNFENRQLDGTATLHIENFNQARTLILDTKDLTIKKVTANGHTAKRSFKLMPARKVYLGQPLVIHLNPGDSLITITYHTAPEAGALQWLTPRQTAGKKHPFLFSQSQAILARTWVPCQDTPSIRFTYQAEIQTSPDLLALMSASNPTEKSPDGLYHFTMEQPIPSYLLALAVGDLEYRPFDARSGVYAEPEMIEKAAYEFTDTPRMMAAAEKLYGPYRWGRYDILVLPPSFPFGGMENPRLTFATPTVITGDRSLVSLIAHELAHSWSGNLVTNATWNDVWLNEGFTTYFELRIMEALYGREYAEMLEQIGYQDLKRVMGELGPDNPDTRLAIDVDDRNPDDGLSTIAYEKGRSFLKMLELAFGRPAFDDFLKKYFNTFAFHSMDTDHFTEYVREELVRHRRRVESRIHLREWIYEPGLPENCPVPDSPEFRKVDAQRAAFIHGRPAGELNVKGWTTHHWLHFLRALPKNLPRERLIDLDNTFTLSASPNSEIAFAWYQLVIPGHYKPALQHIRTFLLHVGRAKFVVPLYASLMKEKAYRAFARKVYEEARPGYHPVTYAAVDKLMSEKH